MNEEDKELIIGGGEPANPRLRVAPIPVEVNGQQMLMFQDPERITEETVLMPLAAAVIVQFLDGNHSLRQIQEELMRASGQLIDSAVIENLVAELDQHLLLDSPRFHDHLMKLNEEWSRERVRPGYHAGRAYPEKPDELIEFLDGFYRDPGGPGALPGPAGAQDLKAIVAPHMEISDSGAVSAHAFKALAERTDASLFIVFGTGHMEGQRMFVPSDKDFATPLGTVPADRELIARISRLRRDRNPLFDYVHKQEHSIEFMVLFLKHALRDRPNLRIVPVLVAGFAPSVLAGTAPGQDPSFKEFIAALREALAERNEPTVMIAGADLAHLGPRYGDQERYAPIRMAEEEAADRKMLDPLLRADRDGFFQAIAAEKDRRRVCGLPPVYAMLAATDLSRGELLKWAYWHDRDSHSVVTFASLAFY